MNRHFSLKDYGIGIFSGFLTGIFLIPVFATLHVSIPYQTIVLLLGVPFVMVLGLFVGGILSRWVGLFFQLSKFAVTGFLNAAVDFGVLNGLIFITGAASGYIYIVFKGISFIVANINSYVWNKFWTFQKTPAPTNGSTPPLHTESVSGKTSKEYIQFFIVSIAGLLINTGAASLVVVFIGPQFGMSVNGWANVGAVCGSAAGLLWNFIGYKLIVFRT